MLELVLSEDLKTLVEDLDDPWPASIPSRLPFPVAYLLERVRQDPGSLELLIRGALPILLKYTALMGAASYLHGSDEADFDINDSLRQLARQMTEGHWMAVIRACSRSERTHLIPEFAPVIQSIEEGPYQVRSVSSRLNLDTRPQGLLSSLITLRNRFTHSLVLDETEKVYPAEQVLLLLRAVIQLMQPLWAYRLANTFSDRTILLEGIGGFEETSRPEGLGDNPCFLIDPNQRGIPFFPLVFGEQSRKGKDPTLLEEESEIYLLNYLERKRTPVYGTVAGNETKRKDYERHINEVFVTKRVWERRKDIDLDHVLDYLEWKTDQKIEGCIRNHLYKPEDFVERKSFNRIVERALDDRDTMAGFLAGTSGSGKTAALIHLARRLNEEGRTVMLVRATEFTDTIVKPKQLERWLTAELGYAGPFGDILSRAQVRGSGPFVLIIDGLNEFTGPERDASLLFGALNHFLSDHQTHGNLKLLLSARSENIGQFFPANRFPLNADETLYQRFEGALYWEMKEFSDEETRAYLANRGTPEETTREVLASTKKGIRTPNTLKRLSVGAIAPEDIRRMDSQALTTHFLKHRLGRDRSLRNVIHQLVRVMEKTKDLTLSEEELRKRAPKLLNRLQCDNWKHMTVLRELGLVQVVEKSDQEGHPTWSLAFTHDSLFDVLILNQKKRMRWMYLTLMFFVFIALFLLIKCGPFIIAHWVDSRMGNASNLLKGSVQSLSLSPSMSQKVEAAYMRVLSVAPSVAERFIDFLDSGLQKIGSLLLGIIMLYSALICAFTYFVNKKDHRDKRVIFFDKYLDVELAKKAMLLTLPIAAFLMVWALWKIREMLIKNVEPNPDIITIPLIVIGVILFIILPYFFYYEPYLLAKKGTHLVQECLSSTASLKKEFYSLLIAYISFTFILMLFLVLFRIQASNFFSYSKLEGLTHILENSVTPDDLALIKKYPLSKKDWETFLNEQKEELESLLQKIEERLNKPILNKKGRRILDIILIGLWILITVGVLAHMWLRLILRRRYYAPG